MSPKLTSSLCKFMKCFVIIIVIVASFSPIMSLAQDDSYDDQLIIQKNKNPLRSALDIALVGSAYYLLGRYGDVYATGTFSFVAGYYAYLQDPKYISHKVEAYGLLSLALYNGYLYTQDKTKHEVGLHNSIAAMTLTFSSILIAKLVDEKKHTNKVGLSFDGNSIALSYKFR